MVPEDREVSRELPGVVMSPEDVLVPIRREVRADQRREDARNQGDGELLEEADEALLVCAHGSGRGCPAGTLLGVVGSSEPGSRPTA